MRLIFPILFVAGALLTAQGAPAMRVVRAGSNGTQLLVNGSFEEVQQGKSAHWSGWQKCYQLALGEGRGRSNCVVCERGEGNGEFGASQTLTLNRTNIAPFIISGWSKAENVVGTPDSGYSLYVDITYADGTPLWGQTVDFDCGTHDWEERRFVLLPDKPVKSFTLHCLFRGHTGKVWFDDASVEEIPTPAGASLFQGVPLQGVTAVESIGPRANGLLSPTRSSSGREGDAAKASDKALNATAVLQGAAQAKPETNAAVRKLSTQDGLNLTLRDGAVTSLQVDGVELGGSSPSGFLARDFAADSDVYGFTGGACKELGLSLEANCSPSRDHIAIEGRVSDTTGKDRAVTLLFALPLEATGWQWGDDVRRSRVVEGNGEFANTISLRSGANGKMSIYPLAAVWNELAGVAFGLDMDHPAQYRLVYHAGTKQFFIAYDFGLTKDTARSPSSVDFRFVLYRFNARGGFRAALQKYYDLFPQQFNKRVSKEGVWMPFTDIAKVPGFEDFGFAFQEGAPNVAFDDQHGFASFVYVEPMSHWLAMPRDVPRTYEGALSVLNKDLAGARGRQASEMAAATLTSGIESADERLYFRAENAPWCDGGVFSLSPDPDIATNAAHPFNKAMVMQESIAAAFKRNEPKQAATGSQPSTLNAQPPPGPGLDGVYLDSLEMAAGELNYRREHFRTASVPLVFDREGRPCQMMIFNTWTFERDIAARMHARGKLLFANAVLAEFSFPAPQLDVLGIEVNWLRQGTYAPDSDAVMSFRRALCRQKPYCLLMNTDFSRFTPEMVERYFQRCLFYGIWPGFFDEEAASKDPYWASAKKWYERDRPLFKKYIPLLRRVTAAGWEPLTYAQCDNPRILIERFGRGTGEAVFLTVLNDTADTQSGTVTADLEAIGVKQTASGLELVSGAVGTLADEGWPITLRPQQAEVLCLSPTVK